MNLGNLLSIDEITKSDLQSINDLRHVITSPTDKKHELQDYRRLVLLRASIGHIGISKEHTLFGTLYSFVGVIWCSFLYKRLATHYVHTYLPLITQRKQSPDDPAESGGTS